MPTRKRVEDDESSEMSCSESSSSETGSSSSEEESSSSSESSDDKIVVRKKRKAAPKKATPKRKQPTSDSDDDKIIISRSKSNSPKNPKSTSRSVKRTQPALKEGMTIFNCGGDGTVALSLMKYNRNDRKRLLKIDLSDPELLSKVRGVASIKGDIEQSEQKASPTPPPTPPPTTTPISIPSPSSTIVKETTEKEVLIKPIETIVVDEEPEQQQPPKTPEKQLLVAGSCSQPSTPITPAVVKTPPSAVKRTPSSSTRKPGPKIQPSIKAFFSSMTMKKKTPEK